MLAPGRFLARTNWNAAMAQGPNRFARAQFYIDCGRAEAAKFGVPCLWSRVVVPGVAHEGMRMSAFAGDYWFGAGANSAPRGMLASHS